MTRSRLPRIAHPDQAAADERWSAGKSRVLDDNVASWAARWRLIAQARRTIDFATYILTADVYGMSFLGALLCRAQEGVRVRALLDATGTLTAAAPKLEEASLEALVAAGVDVRVYNRLGEAAVKSAARNKSPLPFAACSHDKILVVDGAAGITGGRNVADEYFAHPDDDAEAFLDREVELTGREAVQGLVAAFERELLSDAAEPVDARDASPAAATALLTIAATAMNRWLHDDPYEEREAQRMKRSPDRLRAVRHEVLEWSRKEAERLIDGADVPDEQRTMLLHGVHEIAVGLTEQLRTRGALRAKPVPAYDASVRIIDNCSRAVPHSDEINEELLGLVGGARRSILLQSPYVILAEPALAALEDAAKRGVAIALLTSGPTATDSPATQAVFIDQWPRLMARLPTLRLFVAGQRHNVHGKSAVFDDEVALVGSYNLDVISAGLNSEVIAMLQGREAVAAVRACILQLIRRGPPEVYEYQVDRATSGPAIVFGPRDHADPEDLAKVTKLRPAARLFSFLPKIARP